MTVKNATAQMHAGPFIQSRIEQARELAKVYIREAAKCREQAAEYDIKAAEYAAEALRWERGTDYASNASTTSNP